MYAIIATGGKQYRVAEGDSIKIERIDAEVGSAVTFDQVLLVSGDDVKVGAPYVEGATVAAKCEKHGRGKKITIYKYRPKKHSASKKGHRQAYTKLVIEAINA